MQLSDKYLKTSGSVYLTGIQALVRLPLDQMRLDRAAGLKTGAFISGYEGSPLGGYDLALAREAALLAEHDVHFWPAVNEDLAATAIFGAMIANTMGPLRVDGVCGYWYGKGPGVDRSGDAFRHANLAGCPGVSAALVLAGDDPTAKSSTIPHQSDFSLMNWGMPLLMPGNPQEMLDFGLLGTALSRYTGSWAGMKVVTNTCDGGSTVNVDPARLQIHLPGDGYQKKTDPRLIAPPSVFSEGQLAGPRLAAAREFAFRNQLNRLHGARAGARIGIASAGKPYYDLMQALADLGLAHALDELGIRIAKFGMTFPLERRFAREFADGLDLIFVIEEKRPFLELHLRDALYHEAHRPAIIGKEDRDGAPLLPIAGELDPDLIAVALGRVIPAIRQRPLPAPPPAAAPTPGATRMPSYCSGCPHNRSTILLPGQIAGGGTGCHGMGILMGEAQRGYEYCTHMGGEGAPWIGMSPFSERKHIFHNLGDGTFFHSGSLAVQACVAAGVNLTFKLLYNGHVAMTGGQNASNAVPVPELTRKLQADGVKKIVVLVEDVERYALERPRFAEGVEIRDRGELEATLLELEKIPGVTVMLYDQECAAEKRRARSRGKQIEPTLRLVINEEVCEGCGDCVAQSNCMSLHPTATDLGDKMKIHQSSCNKDYTCALGDCPSFVTVKIKEGTGAPKRQLPALPDTNVPQPAALAEITQHGYRIVMPGIGGTGVLTVNAILAQAAMAEGLSVITLDQTGLAQKGGSVVSHLLLAKQPLEAAAQTNAANADLILGFDLLGCLNPNNQKTCDPARTAAVVNTSVTPTADAIRKRLVMAGPQAQADRLASLTNPGKSLFLDASRLAEGLFGSHLAANIFLLGAAWQRGLVPISKSAIEEAIRLNGVAVTQNLQAFTWGRQYAHDPAFVEKQFKAEQPAAPPPIDRYAELCAYQNRSYADQWKSFVDQQPAALQDVIGRSLYKLMAYKDEYEVARLLTKPAFVASLSDTFAAVEWHGFNLHPPLLRALGMKNKLKLGPWFATPLAWMARFKFLRNTPLDVFGYGVHRREERELIAWYRDLATSLAVKLTSENEPEIRAILALPDGIRGYDAIKSRSIAQVKAEAARRLATLATSPRATPARSA